MTYDQIEELLPKVLNTPVENMVREFIAFRKQYLTSDNIDAIYGLKEMDAMKERITERINMQTITENLNEVGDSRSHKHHAIGRSDAPQFNPMCEVCRDILVAESPATTEPSEVCGVANPGGTPCTKPKGHGYRGDVKHDAGSYYAAESQPVGELHTGCVMAKYNLSDEEWDATPKRLQAALLGECVDTSDAAPVGEQAQDELTPTDWENGCTYGKQIQRDADQRKIEVLTEALKAITDQMQEFSDDEYIYGCEPLIVAACAALATIEGDSK